MANNGYLNNGVCYNTLHPRVYSACISKYPSTYFTGVFETGSSVIYTTYCYNSALGNIGNIQVSFVSDCEIPGPTLTEQQQIEAINGLFPAAVAILAIAWGLRYIRVLVAEWLKERNASD